MPLLLAIPPRRQPRISPANVGAPALPVPAVPGPAELATRTAAHPARRSSTPALPPLSPTRPPEAARPLRSAFVRATLLPLGS